MKTACNHDESRSGNGGKGAPMKSTRGCELFTSHCGAQEWNADWAFPRRKDGVFMKFHWIAELSRFVDSHRSGNPGNHDLAPAFRTREGPEHHEVPPACTVLTIHSF